MAQEDGDRVGGYTRVRRFLAVLGVLLLVVWATSDFSLARSEALGGDVAVLRRVATLDQDDDDDPDDDTPTPTDDDGVDTPYTDYDGFNTPLTDGDGVDTPTPTDNDGVDTPLTDRDGIDTPYTDDDGVDTPSQTVTDLTLHTLIMTVSIHRLPIMME